MNHIDATTHLTTTLPQADATSAAIVVELAVASYRGDDRKVPVAIPVGQEYFWTHAWQEGERASDGDLKSGDFEEFEGNDADAIDDWLSSND